MKKISNLFRFLFLLTIKESAVYDNRQSDEQSL
nr:MAG TPA: hypothetical protein [Caudoviricetes sp.]